MTGGDGTGADAASAASAPEARKLSEAPDTSKRSGLIAGSRFYSDAAELFPALLASGYESVTFSTLNVAESGDLNLGDEPLFADGRYVGEPEWPELVAGLAAAGERQLGLLAAWSSRTDLGRARRNFSALRQATPAVVAITFDDRSLRDVSATVAAAKMLSALGFELDLLAAPSAAAPWGEVVDGLLPERPARLLLDLSETGGEHEVASFQQWFAGLALEPVWSGRHGAACNLGSTPDVLTKKAYFMRDQVAGAWVRLLDEALPCSEKYSAASYARALDDAWTFAP